MLCIEAMIILAAASISIRLSKTFYSLDKLYSLIGWIGSFLAFLRGTNS